MSFRQQYNTLRFSTRVLLFCFVTTACVSEVGTHFNVTEVAPGLYVHQGKTVTADHPERDDSANTGFIIGDECIAVIDTGGSPSVGTQLKQAIQDISDRKICYVINTHIHYDHLLGNAAFDDDHIQFVGHKNLAPSVEQNREFFREEYTKELGSGTVIGPELLVSDSMELDLGNRVLTLTAHGPAHTITDLSVYDKTTQTLWLSDLLFIEHIPVLDGKLKGWLAVLEELQAIPAERAIPGHGPVTAPWPAAARDLRRYLETLRDRVRSMLAEGKFMEEIIDQAGDEEAARWSLHEHYHRRNVSKAFTELEWE